MIYSRYNHPESRPKITCDQSKDPTQQDMKESCDINNIVKKFMRTGELPQGRGVPQYGDFASVHDFESSMNIVVNARRQFDAMPSDIRARFNNDPSMLLKFVSDASNVDEAVRLGILKKVSVNENLAQTAPNAGSGVSAPVTENKTSSN